jgi:hypothetical protein
MEFLKQIATQIGVEEEKLIAAMQTAKLQVFPENDFNILKTNIEKSKYEEGKNVGFEMTLKEQKRKVKENFGIETDGIKDFDTLLSKVLETKIEAVKNEYSGKVSKKDEEYLKQIEELGKSKTILQSEIQTITQKFEAEKSEILNKFKQQTADNELLKIINSVPLQVPQHIEKQGTEAVSNYLKSEKKKLEVLFKSNYQIEIEDNKIVLKKDGNLVTDKLQNPAKIEEIILPFAKDNYFSIETMDEKGKRPNVSKTISAIGGTLEDFQNAMSEKGIKQGSNEYGTLYREWKQKNK